ncbi:unnamed protein product [Calypogeia fissa]
MIHHASRTSVGCSSSSASAFFVRDEWKVPWQFPKNGGDGGCALRIIIIRGSRRAMAKSVFLGENLTARASPALFASRSRSRRSTSSRNSHGAIHPSNGVDSAPGKAPVTARPLERRQSSLDSWPDHDDGAPRTSRWDKVKSRPKEQWKPSRPAREPSIKTLDRRDSDDRESVEGIVARGRHRADAEELDKNFSGQPIRLVLAKAKRQALVMKDYIKSFDAQKLLSSTGEHAYFPPFPPNTGNVLGGLGAFLLIWIILDALIWRVSRESSTRNVRMVDEEEGESLRSRAPSALSVLLERDLRRKESVEWVNMVIGKFWNLYRRGIETWTVSLLQPIIDGLEKPEYVTKIEVKQFFLGDEPLTVRTVERRTSRRADDLQYHIGVRYTGGARLLLAITLKWAIIPITIPVGVRGLDVDAEMWVKLRMVPYEPWIGQATWAFVNLPKIKLVLAPFRLVNLMAIPFLSIFLAKLLTEDLPMLFVRPNKNVVDFLEGRVVGPVSKDFKDGVMLDGTRSFAGELSVTLVESRKLPYIPYLKTDPYCIFVLGDQVRRSKRNSQTSIIGPPGAPVWNQDFKLLVVDHKAQHLSLTLHDTLGFTSYPIGSGDIDLRTLQDTVPIDRKIILRSGWGPFPRRFAGELILRLTYKAYIDEDGEEEFAGELTPTDSAVVDVPGAVEQVKEVATFFKEEAGKVAEFFQDKDVAKEMFDALPTITSDKDVENVLPILGLEKFKVEESVQIKSSKDSQAAGNGALMGDGKVVSNFGDGDSSTEASAAEMSDVKQAVQLNGVGPQANRSSVQVEGPSTSQLVISLAVVTGVIWVVAADLNLANLFNP